MNSLYSQLVVFILLGLVGHVAGGFLAKCFTAAPATSGAKRWEVHLSPLGEQPGSQAHMRHVNKPKPSSSFVESNFSIAEFKRTSAKSLEELDSWLAHDPLAALFWYATAGWQFFEDTPTETKKRLAKFSASIEENRSRKAYGQRLAWSSLPGQNFQLIGEWGPDNGRDLADKIAGSPQGLDIMWMVAIGNPANGWPDTAEWVAGLKVDEEERMAVLEQVARESSTAGDGEATALVLSARTDPIFDRAKSVLVAELLQRNPQFAKTAWDSLTSPDAKLATAMQIISNPKTAPAARKEVTRWAEQSGVSLLAGSTWEYIAKKP